MKTLLLLLLCVSPLGVTSCSTPAPTVQAVEVRTLKAVATIADGAVSLAAHLYSEGRITADQARQVNAFYDQRFQPSFRLAVAAAKADFSHLASPDIVALATQLSTLVVSFQK